MATEIAMLHDVSKCTACRGCMVACKQWKELPAEMTPFHGDFQSHKDLSPHLFNLIKMQERMENGKLEWNFIKFQCMHCGEPGCVQACPTGCLQKNDNGVVSYDDSKCIGCRYCETGCPFNVPKVSAITHKVTKCNMCIERLEQGMIPSCAKTCTADAILFGTRAEMDEIAKKRVEVLKKTYPNAQLYGVDKTADRINGTHMTYILTDRPSVFGLPEDPHVSGSMKVWKDVVHPVGKILVGAAAVVIGGAFIVNNLKASKEDDHA